CSLGDGSVTEGEVSEDWQFAVLHQLPVIYLVQDNEWGISVTSKEARTMNAYECAAGFKGMNRMEVDGSDFEASYQARKKCIGAVRKGKGPFVLRASVPLLGHHTSGVRKEWYRSKEDLAEHAKRDPGPALRKVLEKKGIAKKALDAIIEETK